MRLLVSRLDMTSSSHDPTAPALSDAGGGYKTASRLLVGISNTSTKSRNPRPLRPERGARRRGPFRAPFSKSCVTTQNVATRSIFSVVFATEATAAAASLADNLMENRGDFPRLGFFSSRFKDFDGMLRTITIAERVAAKARSEDLFGLRLTGSRAGRGRSPAAVCLS